MTPENKKKREEQEDLQKILRKMVHDIGNPLQIISGRAQLLRDAAEGNEDLTKGLVIIKDQCEVARRVLENMLALFPHRDTE